MDKEYPLKSARTKKKFHVARFVNSKMEFNNWAKPVHMYKDTSQVPQQRKHAPGFIPYGRYANQKERKAPWVIEDAEGKHSYNGAFEGGQNSNYVLFVMQVRTASHPQHPPRSFLTSHISSTS
jgi:hypothetical protein